MVPDFIVPGATNLGGPAQEPAAAVGVARCPAHQARLAIVTIYFDSSIYIGVQTQGPYL